MATGTAMTARRSCRWPDPYAERAWTRSMTRQRQEQQQQVPSNEPIIADPASENMVLENVPPQSGAEKLQDADLQVNHLSFYARRTICKRVLAIVMLSVCLSQLGTDLSSG